MLVTAPRPEPPFGLAPTTLVQTGLDFLGLVPGLNIPANATNATISAVRGDYVDAALSAIGALPVLGTIGKLGGRLPDALRYLEDILRPGGKLIGEAGTKDVIRVLPASEREALSVELSKVGSIVENQRYPGRIREVPGLGNIGFRDNSRFGPTIDINIEGFEDITKIHFK